VSARCRGRGGGVLAHGSFAWSLPPNSWRFFLVERTCCLLYLLSNSREQPSAKTC
jgi:hypothetical protein